MNLTVDGGVIDPIHDSRYLIESAMITLDKLLAQIELNATPMEYDELRGKEKDVIEKVNSLKDALCEYDNALCKMQEKIDAYLDINLTI
jgi:hypothetical protein